MTIKIKLFGITKDIIKKGEIEFVIHENQTVGKLMQTIKNQYPELQKLSSLMLAVNSDYASEDTLLKNGDEIALIPPVSGG